MVPNLHYGALRPLVAPSGIIFYTQSEYSGISNCVFNFNFLALVVAKILGGLKFTLGGAAPLWMPPGGKKFIPKKSTLAYLIAFLISTL